MISQDWTIFIEYYPRFLQVYRKLAGADWFLQDGWTGFVGHYTHGIFLQLFKPHWYNHTFDGIHFELAMDAACAERREASLQLHITHKNLLPDRDAFNAFTIPRMRAVVSGWDDGWELSETKLSQRLNRNIPFTPSTFAPRVAAAITQARQLDAIIDAGLARQPNLLQ